MTIIALCVAALALMDDPTGGQGGLGGGGPLFSEPADTQHGDCISTLDRALVLSQVEDYYVHGPVSGGYAPRATALYDFWPQGGNQYRDLFMNNFVDLNPATGPILDWDCTNVTYDGHMGHDCGLRSFAEQAIGVPIFAIKDGVVVARDDGHFDMNTNPGPNDPANYVIVDHGSGHVTWYWHMKNGSVAVNVGQHVVAGQQLGLTGSSGYSTGPHLHFEVHRSNVVREPFTGACNSGPSGWANQVPIDRTFRPFDFAFSRTALDSAPQPPYRSPSTDQAALSDTRNWFWVEVYNLPANSTWRVRYYRPNGSLAYDSGTGAFNNPAYRWSWWYWWWNINDLHTISGTWRMQLDFNGSVVVNEPLLVSASPDPNFNRAPAPLQGVAFDPPAPHPDDVIFCRVTTSLIDDDPDFDVVSYLYVWTVNGAEVRRITSAAQSDALRVGLAPAGALVQCTVTPGDGRLSGPSTSASVRVVGCGSSDFNHDGDAGTDADIEAFFACIAGNCCAACDSADFNGDGDVATDADIEAFFRVLAGGAC